MGNDPSTGRPKVGGGRVGAGTSSTEKQRRTYHAEKPKDKLATTQTSTPPPKKSSSHTPSLSADASRSRSRSTSYSPKPPSSTPSTPTREERSSSTISSPATQGNQKSPRREGKREGSPATIKAVDPAETLFAPPAQLLFPAEIMAMILSKLPAKDLFNCASISHEFLLASSKDKLWEHLALRDIQEPEIYEALLNEYANLYPTVHLPPHLQFASFKPFYWKSLYLKYKFKETQEEHPYLRPVYNYIPRTERELAINKGEVLELICEDSTPRSCWWLVKKIDLLHPSDNPQQGWIPSGYVEDISPHERVNMMIDAASIKRDRTAEKGRHALKNAMARALYNYVATNDNEISFKEYDLMTILKKGGRMDGEWETDFEDLGLSKKERQAKKKEMEKKERDEFPEEHQKFYWWKVSLTRRAKEGPGNITVEGWIPGNMVTERVEYKIAVMDYEAAGDNEMTLRKGQRVALLGLDPRTKEQGWLFVQASGQRGWAPEHYLADD